LDIERAMQSLTLTCLQLSIHLHPSPVEDPRV
jgi:hypothetical protein